MRGQANWTVTLACGHRRQAFTRRLSVVYDCGVFGAKCTALRAVHTNGTVVGADLALVDVEELRRLFTHFGCFLPGLSYVQEKYPTIAAALLKKE